MLGVLYLMLFRMIKAIQTYSLLMLVYKEVMLFMNFHQVIQVIRIQKQSTILKFLLQRQEVQPIKQTQVGCKFLLSKHNVVPRLRLLYLRLFLVLLKQLWQLEQYLNLLFQAIPLHLLVANYQKQNLLIHQPAHLLLLLIQPLLDYLVMYSLRQDMQLLFKIMFLSSKLQL